MKKRFRWYRDERSRSTHTSSGQLQVQTDGRIAVNVKDEPFGAAGAGYISAEDARALYNAIGPALQDEKELAHAELDRFPVDRENAQGQALPLWFRIRALALLPGMGDGRDEEPPAL